MAASFGAVARSLGHGGELFVTDLWRHHCWLFPSADEMEGMSRDQQDRMLAVKTCICGSVALTELPSGCEWRCLQPVEMVPDVVTEAAGRVALLPAVGRDDGTNGCHVAVVDLCFIKMKAVELAGDLASSILRIAYALRAAT